MAEALRQFLQEYVNRHYDGKARPLSLRAKLNQNTVGNILESGSGAPESLIKLAPYVGKTPYEMFVLAGWLDPQPQQLSSEAAEAIRLLSEAAPEARPLLLAAMEGLAQRLQLPEFQRQILPYLQRADRPAE